MFSNQITTFMSYMSLLCFICEHYSRSIIKFIFSKTSLAGLVCFIPHEGCEPPWQLAPLLLNVYKFPLCAAGLAFRAEQCNCCGCSSWLCCWGGGHPCAVSETPHMCLNWPKMATLSSEAFFHFAQGRIMSLTPFGTFQKLENARSMQYNLSIQMICVWFVMYSRH